MGPNLQKRLHGGPQLWCLRAYQTTGKKKGAFLDLYDNWVSKVEGWFKLMTLEEGELFLTTIKLTLAPNNRKTKTKTIKLTLASNKTKTVAPLR